ncbi:MAG: HAMP domain-containing sensor histidine kinase [Pseudomonadota bacterium]
MSVASPKPGLDQLAHEFTNGGHSLGKVWRQRSYWQVRLRWWVPAAIVVGVFAGEWLGLELCRVPILTVAGIILFYNSMLALYFKRAQSAPKRNPNVERVGNIVQVCLDYIAMFLLIHFTGGPNSPLMFFFVFHVIFAAILFRPSTAYLFATAASLGMAFLTVAQNMGWLATYPIGFAANKPNLFPQLNLPVLVLLSFATTVFVTAACATMLMKRLRERVLKLAGSTKQVANLNDKLNSLYLMIQTVGSEKQLDPIAKIVASELTKVMQVTGITVKLLSEDGETLRYAAVYGLPSQFEEGRIVEVAKSPLNRKVIEGETLVIGEVTEERTFQLFDDLVASGICSVMFAPLTFEDRVIGILGAYCNEPRSFGQEDTSIFTRAAELVAIAIENARYNESAQHLMEERTRFMLQVAHNLRAPLGATASMVNVLADGYLGKVVPRQDEYLQRIDRRLRSMNQTIGELLVLARTQSRETVFVRKPVDLKEIVERVSRTFQEEAAQKPLHLTIHVPDNHLGVLGDPEMLERMLENLVSNSLKYTPAHGTIEVVLTKNEKNAVSIEVNDTGIGIPPIEQSQLFTEFFRASNARKLEDTGTGLGLAIVKQIIDRHNGHIRVRSEEGKGTSVLVELPSLKKIENH